MSVGEQGRLELLSRAAPFRRLEQERVEALADSFQERTYRRREIVFRQGDPGDALLFVAEGLIRVFVPSQDGTEMGLATLAPPDVFGELALVDGGSRSASAQALEPTTILALPRAEFLLLRREYESVSEWLEHWMATLVRRSLDHAADLVFLDLHGRVAKALLSMAGEAEELGGIAVELHMTQSDLASLVGGSRQSVNQALRAFEERGFLELDGRTILIRRPDLLARRAGLGGEWDSPHIGTEAPIRAAQ